MLALQQGVFALERGNFAVNFWIFPNLYTCKWYRLSWEWQCSLRAFHLSCMLCGLHAIFFFHCTGLAASKAAKSLCGSGPVWSGLADSCSCLFLSENYCKFIFKSWKFLLPFYTRDLFLTWKCSQNKWNRFDCPPPNPLLCLCHTCRGRSIWTTQWFPSLLCSTCLQRGWAEMELSSWTVET